MNKYIIRNINITDINSLLKLESEQDIKILSENMFKSLITSKNSFCYLIEYENEILGYVIANILVDHIDIESIVVKLNYQKQGIATKLMNYIITKSKELDIEKIFLEVRPSNTKAINLYNKLEFKYINTRKNYYENGESAYIFLLDL